MAAMKKAWMRSHTKRAFQELHRAAMSAGGRVEVSQAGVYMQRIWMGYSGLRYNDIMFRGRCDVDRRVRSFTENWKEIAYEQRQNIANIMHTKSRSVYKLRMHIDCGSVYEIQYRHMVWYAVLFFQHRLYLHASSIRSCVLR